MKQKLIIFVLFFLSAGSVFAQTTVTSNPAGLTAPARSPLRAVTSTQYTGYTELFAEWRSLLVNTPARFTAHLTQVGDLFKAYTDAEVTVTLIMDGKTSWQQTVKQPAAPGTYRFPIKAETAGTGKVIIDLKMPAYTEQFVVDNVTVYVDEAAALAVQAKLPAPETEGTIPYSKEKSWIEAFATSTVISVKNIILVPNTAVLTEGTTSYVIFQNDPEHFRKQVVEAGKPAGNYVEIKSGLKTGDRIVTLGAEKIK